jgi:hypothetical protein
MSDDKKNLMAGAKASAIINRGKQLRKAIGPGFGAAPVATVSVTPADPGKRVLTLVVVAVVAVLLYKHFSD